MNAKKLEVNETKVGAIGRREALVGLGVAGAMWVGMGARGGTSSVASAAMRTGATNLPGQDVSKAFAAAQQGAGFYRFSVGTGANAVMCASIGDSQARMPSFPLWGENAGSEAVEASLKVRNIDPKNMLMHFNVLTFMVGNEVWLFDAGNGTAGGAKGKLTEHLATLGIKPSDVSGVILSHLHGDHVGGLMDADGKLVFANARYVVSKVEHEFWNGDALMPNSKLNEDWKAGGRATAKKAIAAMTASKKMDLVDDGATITTGVKVRVTGGHTPGHQIVVVESGGEKFEMLADAMHHWVLSFRHPDWHVQFDFDAKEGARVRRSVMDRVASERTKVMLYHTPWPGVGYVIPDGDAFAWQADAWEW